MIRDRPFETALIGIIGSGLPLVSRPYAAIAESLGCSESEVIDGIRRLAMRGDLKRFGVVVRHRRLGYRANGMVVWDIPDARIAEIGPRIGACEFVTLCYQRPRRLPEWRYNLFSMVHGRDRDTVEAQVDSIVEDLQLQDIERRILFSHRCFKQRGASYRRVESAPAPIGAAIAVNE